MKTVIQMARESGWPDSLVAPAIMAKLAEFAELVRADEREQGQKCFDAVTAEREACLHAAEVAVSLLSDPIDAIRARSNP